MMIRFYSTFIALMLAAAIGVANLFGVSFKPDTLLPTLALLSLGAFILPILIRSQLIAPLQRAGAGLSATVVSLYEKDEALSQLKNYLNFLPIIFIILTLFVSSLEASGSLIALLIWIVFFGTAIDAFNGYLNRSTHYLNPGAVVTLIRQHPAESIEEIIQKIDNLAEFGLKSLHNGNSSLSVDAVNAMVSTLRQKIEKAEKTQFPEEKEEVSYALFHLLEQLEMLYIEAEEEQHVGLCSSILTSTGKVAALTALFDLKMALTPLHAIASIAHEAVEEEELDIATKACFTIQEVSRIILQESEKQSGFQELFQFIVKQLAEITKAIFRKDKTIPVSTLMPPFAEIKKALGNSHFANNPDSKSILKALDDVLEQFSALSHVMTHKEGPKQPDIIKEEQE